MKTLVVVFLGIFAIYCGHCYYDGDHAAIRLGKFYVGVSY